MCRATGSAATWHDIFNETPQFAGSPQQEATGRQSTPPLGSVACAEVAEAILGLGLEHTVEHVVGLRSVAGCKQQAAHTDCDPEAPVFNSQDPGDVPLSLLFFPAGGSLIAFSPGESCLSDGSEIPVAAGHAVIFRGDFRHGGAAYAAPNVRVFAFLDVPAHSRLQDRSYPCCPASGHLPGCALREDVITHYFYDAAGQLFARYASCRSGAYVPSEMVASCPAVSKQMQEAKARPGKRVAVAGGAWARAPRALPGLCNAAASPVACGVRSSARPATASLAPL